MSKEYTLTGGPSKFNVMLGLFDHQDLVFKTDSHDEIVVRVRTIKVLNDDGLDAWSIKGYVQEEDGTYHNRHECHIVFSSRNRRGSLTNFGPKNETNTVEYLDGLSDNELREEIASNQRGALDWKRQLEEYLKEVGDHDRLVIEARASQRMVEVSAYTMLDHRAHVIKRSQGTVPAVRR